MAPRVWYAAYGSNLLAARFAKYLEGGSYGASPRAHRGARDPSPPRSWELLRVDHQLRFGHESKRWGGGVAFLDPSTGSGSAVVRCWDVTAQQFADVAAQENGLEPGELHIDVAEVIERGWVDVTEAWYGRALALGSLGGRPVVTFTAAHQVAATSPGRPYLHAISAGLRECAEFGPEEIASYLHRAPGVGSGWDLSALRTIAAEPTS